MEVFPKSSYHWTYLQNSLRKEVMGDYGHILPKTQGKNDGRRRGVIRYSAASCEDADGDCGRLSMIMRRWKN
jgi:hypothetical protein